MTTAIEIEAVAELDRAVAEAIGWFTRADGAFNDCWHSALRAEWTRAEFTPSTNLNAAFAAAAEVRLWKGRALIKDWDELPDGWRVVGLFEVVDLGCEPAATPALAICAAILKLKGEPA